MPVVDGPPLVATLVMRWRNGAYWVMQSLGSSATAPPAAQTPFAQSSAHLAQPANIGGILTAIHGCSRPLGVYACMPARVKMEAAPGTNSVQ